MVYAGIELGGTKCVAILARDAGDVLARETIPTSAPDETLARLERLLLDWKQDAGFAAVGIASFGPIDVDPDSATWGHILSTPKPGWAGANVAPRLRDALAVPVVFDTDVNGAALAEMRWGAGRGLEDFAYVTVGTGVGVGLIVNGQPTRGLGHCELGHVRVPRIAGDDWRGSCPYHGDCVEGLASGSSLEARFGERLAELQPDHPILEVVAHPFIAGFVLAAVLAAIMSTISSQLLVTSSSLTNDIYRTFLNRDAPEKHLVMIGRTMVVLVAIVAAILALDPDSTVLGIVGNAWAGFGAAFGPAILFSLRWKRTTREGVLAGMIVGAAVVVAWILLGWSSAMYEIVPGFIASCLAIWLVSKATAEPSPEIQSQFDEAAAAAQGA